MVLTTVPWWARILRIPFSIITPLIIVFCAVGAYAVHNSTSDILLMLSFGVLGYLLRKLDYPLAPLVLALGDLAEASFRHSMLLSQGSLAICYSTPLVGSLVTLALVMPAWPALVTLRALFRREPAAQLSAP